MKNALHKADAFGLSSIAIISVLTLSFSTFLSDSQTVKAASKGETLFTANCATCHKDGGNIINPKKPLKGSAQLASKDSLKSYLLKPTGAMAPYPAIANNAADLAALYDYCKGLK